MRKAICIAALTLLCFTLPIYSAVPSSAYSFDDLSFSSLYNAAYSGRHSDSLINPAFLSRIENPDAFYFTFLMSESWDTDVMKRKEDMYALQNYTSEMQFSFVGDNLAVTAFFTTWFADRQLTDSGLSFDIYNRIGLQIDYSASFDFFSLGLRLKGGGEMRRRDRNITGVINAIEHAYFGSFDNVDGSEYFGLGASVAFDFDFLTFSYFVDDIISYRGNDLYFGWQEILDSSVFSISLRYPKFTNRGDLNLIRPRVAYSIQGNIFDRATVTFNAELEMQLLPTLYLHLGAGYREYDHNFLDFDSSNGVLMLGFAMEADSYAFSLMCNVDTERFSRVYPSISFTISR